MLWVFLSILAGLGDATMFALMKKLKGVDRISVLWVLYMFALPFLLILLFFNYPENINPKVYWIAGLNAFLLALTMYFILKAIQESSLSKSIPMLSLTPLFLLVTSYLMVNEFPSFYGVMGVILIVFGAYAINIKQYKEGIFEPFRHLYKDKGSRYILFAAFIMSIMANLFKLGILNSNPAYYNVLIYSFIPIILSPFLINGFKRKILDIKKNFKTLLLLGFSSAFMATASSLALLTAIVPYVISLKRSSIIFSIFYGYFMFREKDIKYALVGSFVMLLGVILITLF